jgi:hypothetical protein
MKKYPINYKLLIICALASSLLSSPSSMTAQGRVDHVYFASMGVGNRDISRSNVLRLNDIPALAARHLHKNYQKTESVSWSRKQGGYVATLNQDGRLHQINYDQAGNFQYSIRFLEVKDLGEQMLKQIKKEYPAFAFDIIAEVKNEIRTEIILTLKNEYVMKSLMIRNGQIQVIDQLDYASR